MHVSFLRIMEDVQVGPTNRISHGSCFRQRFLSNTKRGMINPGVATTARHFMH